MPAIEISGLDGVVQIIEGEDNARGRLDGEGEGLNVFERRRDKGCECEGVHDVHRLQRYEFQGLGRRGRGGSGLESFHREVAGGGD